MSTKILPLPYSLSKGIHNSSYDAIIYHILYEDGLKSLWNDNDRTSQFKIKFTFQYNPLSPLYI